MCCLATVTELSHFDRPLQAHQAIFTTQPFTEKVCQYLIQIHQLLIFCHICFISFSMMCKHSLSLICTHPYFFPDHLKLCRRHYDKLSLNNAYICLKMKVLLYNCHIIIILLKQINIHSITSSNIQSIFKVDIYSHIFLFVSRIQSEVINQIWSSCLCNVQFLFFNDIDFFEESLKNFF